MRDFHCFNPWGWRKEPFSLARLALVCIEQIVNIWLSLMSLPVLLAPDSGPRCPLQRAPCRCANEIRMGPVENPDAKPAPADWPTDRATRRLDPLLRFGGCVTLVRGRMRGDVIRFGRLMRLYPTTRWGAAPDQLAGYGERRAGRAMRDKTGAPGRSTRPPLLCLLARPMTHPRMPP